MTTDDTDKKILRKPGQITIREGRDGGAALAAYVSTKDHGPVLVYQRLFDQESAARTMALRVLDQEFEVRPDFYEGEVSF